MHKVVPVFSLTFQLSTLLCPVFIAKPSGQSIFIHPQDMIKPPQSS